MHHLLLSLLLCLFALQSSAQQETRAKVFLTNDDVVSGILQEYIIGSHLTIRTVGDNVITIPQADIRSVDMGEGSRDAAPPQTAVPPMKPHTAEKTLGNVYFESHIDALMAIGLGSSRRNFSDPGLFFGAYSANGVGIRQSVFIGLGVGFQGHTEKPSFTIAMDYRVVTDGEGAVTNLGFTDPMKFSKIFSRGDIPLDLKSLPSVDRLPRGLDLGELEQCNEIDPETGGPCFWHYYEVKVEYTFSLDVKEGLSIIEGLTWVSECPDSRGLITTIPFPETLDKWRQTKKLTIADIRNERPPNETDDNLKYYLGAKNAQAQMSNLSSFYALLIESIVSADQTKYTNANLFFDEFLDITLSAVFEDVELQNFIASIGSILHRVKSEMNDNNPWIEIKVSDSIMNVIEKMSKESLIAYSKMQNDTGNDITLGVGSVGLSNYVFLNPKLFEGSPSAISFSSVSMLPEEILAHEAGHNAADEFHHRHTKEGPYEYHQEGLQSNVSGKIYPTVPNTIGILEDEENRKNMRIE